MSGATQEPIPDSNYYLPGRSVNCDLCRITTDPDNKDPLRNLFRYVIVATKGCGLIENVFASILFIRDRLPQ